MVTTPPGALAHHHVQYHVQAATHGPYEVHQHTIHAARQLATPPSANSNDGRWHVDTQHGVVTVLTVQRPTASGDLQQHTGPVLKPVCFRAC